MISKSKEHNPNYLCKIVEIKNLRKHENADKLQIATIDFQSVVVGENTKVGDICVFFPVESQINFDFLKATNAFRHPELNKDKEQKGFFEDNGRVRAVKLRGERSMGYLVPIKELEQFANESLSGFIGEEFDTIGKTLIVKKYFVPIKAPTGLKQGRVSKRISRLVDGQFHFHIDTENLRKEAYKIKPEDEISITYKIHGTSFIVANVLCKRKLNIIEGLLKRLGVNIKDTEYDILHASRKVIKNQYETRNANDFYGYDMWKDIAEEIKEFVPKGYTIYGECAGFTKNGTYIQGSYDYGCKQGDHKLFIYRITFTNQDGMVYNLSTAEIKEFCDKAGLNYVPLFYKGIAKDLIPDSDIANHWHEDFINYLEKHYTDKDCFLCKNKVSEEGIVIRKESWQEFEAFKLKSFRFLEWETKQLDDGVVDLESAN